MRVLSMEAITEEEEREKERSQAIHVEEKPKGGGDMDFACFFNYLFVPC